MRKPSASWSEHDSKLAPITLEASAHADAPILIREPQCKLAVSTYVGLTSLDKLDVGECECLACVHAVVRMTMNSWSFFLQIALLL